MDSKKEIYDLIPQKYYPKTILIKKYQDKKTVINKIQSNNIKYPFIVKPDAGLRGTAVKKIENQIDLENYIKKANFDYLVQQLIPYQNEIGLFYIKNPNQKKGKITGIVKKEFLSVIGDGKCNIKQLIKKNKRAAIQLKNLEKENNINTTQIISKGKTKILVPFGNHCRGAKFIDDSSKITPELTETINKICEQINGFYYGRLDIMFTDYNKLENQKEFQIVEINGAISEPTHIYDSKHNILFAWKTLCYHYSQLYKISKQNHKSGYSYLKTKQGFKEWKKHYKHYTKILKF